MPGSHGTLCINSFYPETELNITEIQEYEKQILIRMKSISKDCRCPKCGCITDKYHGTYIRKVQDLPILGKRVQLEICSHEYECINDGCEVTTFAETFDGSWTNRCVLASRSFLRFLASASSWRCLACKSAFSSGVMIFLSAISGTSFLCPYPGSFGFKIFWFGTMVLDN